MAIAVFIATALGYGIVLPDSAVQSAYARQFSQACKWSAITSLTISAPVISLLNPLSKHDCSHRKGTRISR